MGHEDMVLSSAGGAILVSIVANLALGLPGAAAGLILGAFGLPFLVRALRRREHPARV